MGVDNLKQKKNKKIICYSGNEKVTFFGEKNKTVLINVLIISSCMFPRHLIYRFIRFQDTSIPWLFSKRFYQEQFESIVLKVLQKGNIEGFSFRYLNFYNWHSLIHVLAKNNAHSLRRLEFSGLEPTVLLEQSEIGSTLISMSSLMNLQVITSVSCYPCCYDVPFK